ncbi:MAG: DUF6171 family protein [Treponema sp.]|nr:DUF6171 family protein [Treponema sp.]
MPVSLRAGESLLRRRLACCSSCDSLREQVLCAQCGCFVRFRAAVLKSWCPSPAGDKWAAYSGSAVSPGCAGGLAEASSDLPFSPNAKTEFALSKTILNERSIT